LTTCTPRLECMPPHRQRDQLSGRVHIAARRWHCCRLARPCQHANPEAPAFLRKTCLGGKVVPPSGDCVNRCPLLFAVCTLPRSLTPLQISAHFSEETHLWVKLCAQAAGCEMPAGGSSAGGQGVADNQQPRTGQAEAGQQRAGADQPAVAANRYTSLALLIIYLTMAFMIHLTTYLHWLQFLCTFR